MLNSYNQGLKTFTRNNPPLNSYDQGLETFTRNNPPKFRECFGPRWLFQPGWC